MNDLRFAFRQLLKNPGYTAVAILTLALGIGATTAIVSVVRATLLSPLPVRHPERLAQIWAVHRRDGYRTPGLSPRAIEQLRQQTNLFQRLVVYEMDGQRLTGDGLPERIRGARVSPDFFSLLNGRPERGRGFNAQEFKPGYGDVVILSHALWQTRFGGDPAIIGHSIRFLEGSLTVVGVMPASFAFPASSTSYWRPLAAPPDEGSLLQDVVNLGVMAELRENTQLRQVEALLELVQRRLADDRPSDYDEYRFEAMAMRDNFATPFLRRTLWALAGAIALVLLIACGNLTSLQLVRMETRQRELAVRAALGAGRRLFRQLLTESLLLAALGGWAGLAVAVLGIDGLVALLPPGLPRLKPISLDLGALAVAAGVTLATGLAFGLLPAWRGGRTSLSAALKLSATATTQDRRGRWLSRALIAGQVALAVVLLGGAGLMVRSVIALLTVDPGFDPRGVVNFTPQFDENQRPTAAIFGAEVRQRVASVPGVEAVGLWFFGTEDLEVASAAGGMPVRLTEMWMGVGAADPLRVLRARLKSGRWLEQSDTRGGVVPVLVNESAASRLWLGADPLGQRIWGTGTNQGLRYEVVGVVKDMRLERYDLGPEPTLYRTAVPTQVPDSPGNLILRAAVPYATLQKGIEHELNAVGANRARPRAVHWNQRLYDGTAGHRTLMQYLVLFALVGLFLAALGLYGVLAFSVARRTREIGIRLAVGASPSDVFRLILGQGLMVATLGGVVGMVGANLGTRWLRSFLFGVAPQDPLTLIIVVLLLSAVALLACWWPARRAMNIDPMVALRSE